MPQHPLGQRPQLRAGLHPDLVAQVTARRLVGRDRVGLPPAPVERRDREAPEPLAQRVRGGQRLQFGQRGGRAARGDLRGEVVLHQQQVFLGQPRAFGVACVGGGQLRLAPPAAAGVGEPGRGVVVVSGEPGDPGAAAQVLDGEHVQLGGPGDDPVAALQPRAPGGGERSAGPGDVRLHGLDRRRRRVVPEPVGERGRGDRPRGGQREQRQHLAGLAPGHGHAVDGYGAEHRQHAQS